MKLLITVLLLFGFSYTSTAQLKKGIWLVGGSGSFYAYSEEYSSANINQKGTFTNIDVTATLGYFIIDKFALGLRPGFNSYKGKITTPGGGSTNSFQLVAGPFLRYYFLKVDKPFNFLADLCYQPGINKYLNGAGEKGKFNTLSILGGAELFFNSAVGIEILMGYSSKIITIDNTPGGFKNTRRGFKTSVGFQIHLDKL